MKRISQNIKVVGTNTDGSIANIKSIFANSPNEIIHLKGIMFDVL